MENAPARSAYRQRVTRTPVVPHDTPRDQRSPLPRLSKLCRPRFAHLPDLRSNVYANHHRPSVPLVVAAGGDVLAGVPPREALIDPSISPIAETFGFDLHNSMLFPTFTSLGLSRISRPGQCLRRGRCFGSLASLETFHKVEIHWGRAGKSTDRAISFCTFLILHSSSFRNAPFLRERCADLRASAHVSAGNIDGAAKFEISRGVSQLAALRATKTRTRRIDGTDSGLIHE
jgi:hypothetical protein